MNSLERDVEQLNKLASKGDSNSANKLELLAENSAQSDTTTDQSYEDTVKQLAKLKPYQFDRVRKVEAKKLGVKLKTLEADVETARHDESEYDHKPFAEIEPHSESIDPKQLLCEVSNTIRQFIVLDKEQADAVALWVAFTWFMDVVNIAPLLIISAPEKSCGKTLLLDLLTKIVCRPLATSNMKAATLFRMAEKWHPSILIDEADTFMKADDELAGLINAGHTRATAKAWRLVGKDFDPKDFNVWGAKAFAGISIEKHLPDATISRAIVINLRRKLKHESVSRLRYAGDGLFEELSAKLARFAEDYSQQVKDARPTLPEELTDRAQDNWEPLLAIAQCAGDEWVKDGTLAAMKLSCADVQVVSKSNELLADIQKVFEEKELDKIGTKDLTDALVSDEEKPWATYNRGKPITPSQVSKLLTGYGIKSKTVRTGNRTAKGFEISQFDDAFNRYLATPLNLPTQGNNSPKANNDADLGVTFTENHKVTQIKKVTPEPAPVLDCDVVTFKEPVLGGAEEEFPKSTHLRI